MLAYIGQGILSVAALTACLGTVLKCPLPRLRIFMGVHFAFILGAFCLLLYAHITSDFSLVNVFRHSHTAKPLLYKISGVWGNHEGSMLLWVLLLAGYGSVLSITIKRHDPVYQTTLLTILSALSFIFTSFLIVACDPFTAMAVIPLEGQDLNPLLQDPALAIHPPCLYLGYVGFAVPFAWVLTFLIHGQKTLVLLPQLYRWTLFAWTFLTLGLGLGSFWAYYELGWGGWWFWDPVENAALMPWLCGTALLHVLHVVQHKKQLVRFAIFLSILTFSLCLLGTILVRSGLLTSVHTFAVDPERGFLLLGISILICGTGILLFLMRHGLFLSPHMPSFMGRAGFLTVGSFILCSSLATVFIGTLYPLVAEFFGQTVSVGTPYFNRTFVPMILPALCLMGLAPFFPWQPQEMPSPQIHKMMEKVLPPLIATFLCVWGFFMANIIPTIVIFILNLVAVWMITASVFHLYQKRHHLSRRLFAMTLAHAGIGVMMLGMTYSTLHDQEVITALSAGEKFDVGPYTLQLEKVSPLEGPNYHAQQASLILSYQNKVLGTLLPEKRSYWTQKILHGETAIYHHGLDHIYLSLGEEYIGGKWSIRAYHKPWINLLWLGGILIVCGGFLALSRRRLQQTVGIIIMSISVAWGMNAHEQLADPILEKRARTLCQQLYCPSCAGQSLDDSPSESAMDLRRILREKLLQGQSDAAIIDYFVQKFGPRVRCLPPLSWGTIALWGLPWIIFSILGPTLFWHQRRQKRIT